MTAKLPQYGMKSWGRNYSGGTGNVITDVLHINRGGYSSRHCHPSLDNCFVLVDGAIDIIREDEVLGTIELRHPGQSCVIPAGEYH